MPKHVGTWVMVVQEGDLTKFGKDSDTEFPCAPDDKEAVEIATQLTKCNLYEHIYIAHVFDNGQMKTFDFEGTNVQDYDDLAAGYCKKCRDAEINRFERLLGAGKRHESVCLEVGCKHPPHYCINE